MDHDHLNEIILFAETNFRNQRRRFGIKTDDRRRHVYIVGKTGMGKTTMLEQMVLSDIYAGHGVGLVDPHGDFAEHILDFIPSWRVNDVIYFNPADLDFPIGFNILETIDERYRHLVASGLMGVFKKIWPDVWSARMEYILLNCVLALLEYPGSTLLGINRLLADKEYRKRVIAKISDPVVKAFWVDEFARYSERFAVEAIAPIQNKVGQFLSAAVIRNIVAQVKSTINIREIMDQEKILIMNLSKGRVGEDNSRLLGGMLITKIQLAAMERVDIPEEERRDLYLYVDEFQNFATESFANILSEARKYRLNLIVAHQYIEQLDEKVAAAVFGNVGSIITFRVGAGDAEPLAKEYAPTFTEEDLVNLPKYNVYLRLMIDGVASNPFSATTFPPAFESTGNRDKVIKVSRERYAEARGTIEEKITRWSGMVGGEEPSPTSVAEVAAGRPAIASGEEARKKKKGFDTTCARCGKPTTVPFIPKGIKPVYCRECFALVERGEAQPVAVAPPAVPLPVQKKEIQAPVRPVRLDFAAQNLGGFERAEAIVRVGAEVPGISLAEAMRPAVPLPAKPFERRGTQNESSATENKRLPPSQNSPRQIISPHPAPPPAVSGRDVRPGEIVVFDDV